jgi:hypothetical protein
MVSPRTRDILLSHEDLVALLELRGVRARKIISDGACTFWFDVAVASAVHASDGSQDVGAMLLPSRT